MEVSKTTGKKKVNEIRKFKLPERGKVGRRRRSNYRMIMMKENSTKNKKEKYSKPEIQN
jgi:hypothetical protein